MAKNESEMAAGEPWPLLYRCSHDSCEFGKAWFHDNTFEAFLLRQSLGQAEGSLANLSNCVCGGRIEKILPFNADSSSDTRGEVEIELMRRYPRLERRRDVLEELTGRALEHGKHKRVWHAVSAAVADLQAVWEKQLGVDARAIETLALFGPPSDRQLWELVHIVKAAVHESTLRSPVAAPEDELEADLERARKKKKK